MKLIFEIAGLPPMITRNRVASTSGKVSAIGEPYRCLPTRNLLLQSRLPVVKTLAVFSPCAKPVISIGISRLKLIGLPK